MKRREPASPPNMPHTSISVCFTFRLSSISISHSVVSDILQPRFATVCRPAVRQNTCRLFGVINSGFLYATFLLSLKKKVPFCTIICLPQFHIQFNSVQFSRSVVSDSLRPHESQHAGPPCPSQTPRAYSNPCPSSR